MGMGEVLAWGSKNWELRIPISAIRSKEKGKGKGKDKGKVKE